MAGAVPINRHSAPIPGNGSAGSESLLPGPLAPRQIRASVPLPEAREGGFRGIHGHPGPIGQPVQLTLPPPPGGPTEGSAELGVASIAQGMDKVSQARVDVARRGFWRKCLSVAAATTALVLMSVATGGLGAAGLVSLGLTAIPRALWRNTTDTHDNRNPRAKITLYLFHKRANTLVA